MMFTLKLKRQKKWSVSFKNDAINFLFLRVEREDVAEVLRSGRFGAAIVAGENKLLSSIEIK